MNIARQTLQFHSGLGIQLEHFASHGPVCRLAYESAIYVYPVSVGQQVYHSSIVFVIELVRYLHWSCHGPALSRSYVAA